MLVLSRKSGERIMIGEQVELIVLGVTRGRVQLGIVAPRSIAIDRFEIRQRIEDEMKNLLVVTQDETLFEVDGKLQEC